LMMLIICRQNKTMLRRISSICAITSLLFTYSCSKTSADSDETSGNWIYRSEFKGSTRSNVASFVVGDSAYVGTGYDGIDRMQDFWVFSPDGNGAWSQRAIFPGAARERATGFSVNGYGYLMAGFDGINKLKDVWRFSPASNSWEQKNDFGGTARYNAVSFVLGDTAYVATGYANNEYGSGSSNSGDCWAYVASQDKWIEKAFDGSKRTQAVAFTHNGLGYICTGNNNGTQLKDFWSYNPATGSWTQLRKIANETDDSFDDDYSDIVRSDAVAFVMGDYAYLATGANGANTLKTWKYDFAADQWTRKSPFEGNSRVGATAFVVKNRGFLTMGAATSGSSTAFDDIWEFNPDQELDDTDNN